MFTPSPDPATTSATGAADGDAGPPGPADRPWPAGWNTAVALLRVGLHDRAVLQGLRIELELDEAGAHRALAFAAARLAEADAAGWISER
jgi:hypothetical protein